MAVLKDRADSDGELLAAVVALEQPGAMRFALHPSEVLHRAAVRANRPSRPQDALHRFAGLFFGEGGNLVKGQHGGLPTVLGGKVAQTPYFVKCIIPIAFYALQ